MRVEDSGRGSGKGHIRAAFRWHAENCRNLGSPFVARVCELFSERLQPDGAVAAKLLGWPGDGGFSGALPLRVVGALHALVLEGRRLRFEPDGESPGGAVTLTVCLAVGRGAVRCESRFSRPLDRLGGLVSR